MISNFLINKNSQGRKSVREKSTYYCKFGFTKVSRPKYHQTRKKIPQEADSRNPMMTLHYQPLTYIHDIPFPSI